MNEPLIFLYSYIKSSTYRRKVLQTLYDKPLSTPKDIATLTGIQINHISNTLKQLKEKNLIYCCNEEAKKGRIYQLTNLGQDVSSFYIDNDGCIYNFKEEGAVL